MYSSFVKSRSNGNENPTMDIIRKELDNYPYKKKEPLKVTYGTFECNKCL